jgi:hypothetical protein
MADIGQLVDMAAMGGAMQPQAQTAVDPMDFSDQQRKSMIEMIRQNKIAEAEKAVSAAIRFQALRGYRRDLESGRAAHEAMAKWGPALFYSTPSALGAVQRALTPPRNVMPQWVPPDTTSGAPGYFHTPGRAPTVVRPPSTTTPATRNWSLNPAEKDEIDKLNEEAKKAAQDLQDWQGPMSKDLHTADIESAKKRIDDIAAKKQNIFNSASNRFVTPNLNLPATPSVDRTNAPTKTPTEGTPTQRFTSVGSPTIDEARQQAKAAISKGKLESAVRARFKELYNEDL